MSRISWVHYALGGAGVLLLLVLVQGTAAAQANIVVDVSASWDSTGATKVAQAVVVLIIPDATGKEKHVATVTGTDGRAEFRINEAFNLTEFDASNPIYHARVDKAGYIHQRGAGNYTSGTNTVSVALPPAIDVAVKTEFGTSTPAASSTYRSKVTLYDGASPVMAVSDGASGDADGAANGLIRVLATPEQFSSGLRIAVERPGFLKDQTSVLTLTNMTQVAHTFNLPYRLKVVLKDELMNPLTSGGSSVVTLKHGGNAFLENTGSEYWIPAVSEGVLEASKPGYVSLSIAEDTGLAGLRTSDSAQTVVFLSGTQPFTGVAALGGTIVGSGLRFTVKVIVNDELGNRLPTAATVKVGSTTHVVNASNPLVAHVAYVPATGAGALTVEKAGYVKLLTAAGHNTGLASVKPSTEDQTVVTLTGHVPYAGTHVAGADVTGTGMKYQLKVTVSNELNMPLEAYGTVPDGTPNATVRFAGALPAVAVGNVSYFTPAGTSGALDASMPGYVNLDRTPTTGLDRGFAAVTVADTAQTTILLTGATPYQAASNAAGASLVGSGLKYRLKVVVNDELANSLATAGNVVTTEENGHVTPASAFVGNASYFTNSTPVTVKASRPGFVDTSLAGVPTSATAQTIVFLNGTTPAGTPVAGTTIMHLGLRYQVKVVVSDEFNASIASPSVSFGALAPARAHDNVTYFAPTGGTAATVHATKAGFVSSSVAGVQPTPLAQTVVNFFGTGIAEGPTEPRTHHGQGLRYPVRVTGVHNEKGDALPILSGTVQCSVATSVRQGVAYCALDGTGEVKAMADGFVTVAIPVTASTQAQTTVCFGCAPADGLVIGPKLPYRLKVVVNDELGNPLTDAAVTHGGAGIGHKVGNAYYFATTQPGALAATRLGYVALNTGASGDSGLGNVVTSPTRQAVVTLTGTDPYKGTHAAGQDATGSGLKFRLKVYMNDETGASLEGATVTFAGQPPARTSGNASYFATTTTGGLAASKAGMLPLDAATENTGFASFSTSSSAQTTIFLNGTTPFTGAPAAGQTSMGTPLRYHLKVVVADELGQGVAAAGVKHGGAAPARVSGDTSYFATTAAGALTFEPVGYLSPVAANPGLASVPGPGSAQTVLILNGNAPPLATAPAAGSTTTLGGLAYAVKVLGIADESGALPEGAAISCGVPAVVHEGVHYCALTAERVVTATAPGRVRAAHTVPDSAVQTTLRFGPGAADVSLPALKFRLKVLVADEFGNALHGAAVWHGAAAPAHVSGNAHYFNATAPAPVLAQKAGFVSLSTALDTGLATVSTTDARQTLVTLSGATPFTGSQAPDLDATGSGLKYALQVLVHDELGAARTGATVLHGGAAPAHVVGNAHYFAAADAGPLHASRAGYVSLSLSADTGLASVPVSSTARTVVSLTGATPYTGTPAAGQTLVGSGLKFALKVVVRDELGNPLVGAFVRHGDASPATSQGATHYFAATQPGALLASRGGYARLDTAVDTGLASVATTPDAQTVVTLSGATAYTGGAFAGTSVTGSGLKHAVKVLGVKDALGNDLALGTAATVACSGVTPILHQGAYHCPVQEAGALVTASAAGYVSSTVPVAPDANAQITVRFGPGAAVLTGAALEHALRVTVIQTWDNNSVEGARVLAFTDPTRTVPIADLTTDAQGRVHLAHAGGVHFVVTAPGRVPGFANATAGTTQPALLTVSLAGNLTVTDVHVVGGSIQRGADAHVRFTVRYPDGDPVFRLALGRVALVGAGPAIFADAKDLENETGTFTVALRVPADMPAGEWRAAVPQNGAWDALTPVNLGPESEARSGSTYPLAAPASNPPPSIPQPPPPGSTPPPAQPPADTVRPTSALTSSYGAWTTAGTLTLPFTASDNGELAAVTLMAAYSADGVAYGNYEQVGSQLTSPFTFTPSKDGHWRFYTAARDASGNVEVPPASADVQVGVDRTAPTIRIVAPAEGVQPVALRLAAEVVEARPGAVTATLDGKPLQVTLQGGTATATLPALEDGEHVVTLTVRDLAGNERTATRTFRLLAAAPTVTVSPIPDVLPRGGTQVEVRANASDLRSIVVRLDGDVLAEGQQSPLTFRLDPRGLDHGEHVLTVVATDALGAEGTVTVRFTVDARAPVITVETPAEGADVGDTVSGVARDADGELALVRLLLDGRRIGESTTGAFTFTVDRTGLAPGRHNLTLVATDEAGNEARKELGFTIARSDPRPATPTVATPAPTGPTPTSPPATPTATPPPGDEDKSFLPLPGPAALLAAIAAAGLLLRRRKA